MSRSPRVRELENAISRLLDALYKQRFPPGGESRCNYSLNVESAMQHAAGLLPRPPKSPTAPGDIAREAE